MGHNLRKASYPANQVEASNTKKQVPTSATECRYTAGAESFSIMVQDFQKMKEEMENKIPTDPGLATLFEQARQAALNSYAPYSHFRVGAALRLTSGEVVCGTNVENASYGLTLCAERSALVRAVSQFGPEIRIEAAAIANLNNAPSPPCGACRQVLAEFILPDAQIIFASSTGVSTVTFSDIMPLAFDMKLK
jgi:homotetrameric cytidine deaminase